MSAAPSRSHAFVDPPHSIDYFATLAHAQLKLRSRAISTGRGGGRKKQGQGVEVLAVGTERIRNQAVISHLISLSYELFTGRPPFIGATAQETIDAITKKGLQAFPSLLLPPLLPLLLHLHFTLTPHPPIAYRLHYRRVACPSDSSGCLLESCLTSGNASPRA